MADISKRKSRTIEDVLKDRMGKSFSYTDKEQPKGTGVASVEEQRKWVEEANKLKQSNVEPDAVSMAAPVSLDKKQQIYPEQYYINNLIKNANPQDYIKLVSDMRPASKQAIVDENIKNWNPQEYQRYEFKPTTEEPLTVKANVLNTADKVLNDLYQQYADMPEAVSGADEPLPRDIKKPEKFQKGIERQKNRGTYLMDYASEGLENSLRGVVNAPVRAFQDIKYGMDLLRYQQGQDPSMGVLPTELPSPPKGDLWDKSDRQKGIEYQRQQEYLKMGKSRKVLEDVKQGAGSMVFPILVGGAFAGVGGGASLMSAEAQAGLTTGLSQVVGSKIAANVAGRIAGGMTAGSLASGATIGLQSGGGAAQQALDKGATGMQAIGTGILTGAAEVATEQLLGFVPGNIEARLAKMTGNRVKDSLKLGVGLLKNASEEGLEEVIMGVLEPTIQRKMYDPNAQINLKDISYQGMIGFILGLAFSGGQVVEGVGESRAIRQDQRDSLDRAIQMFNIENTALLRETQKAGQEIFATLSADERMALINNAQTNIDAMIKFFDDVYTGKHQIEGLQGNIGNVGEVSSELRQLKVILDNKAIETQRELTLKLPEKATMTEGELQAMRPSQEGTLNYPRQAGTNVLPAGTQAIPMDNKTMQAPPEEGALNYPANIEVRQETQAEPQQTQPKETTVKVEPAPTKETKAPQIEAVQGVGEVKQEVKKETQKVGETIKAGDTAIKFNEDDIDLKLAESAFRNVSFDPDKRARQTQKDYINAMQYIIDEYYSKAETPEQKEAVIQAIENYKRIYLRTINAYLQSSTGLASPMITGPAKFPYQRMEKKQQTVMKRLQEYLDGIKNAENRIKKALKPKPTQADSIEAIKKTIDEGTEIVKDMQDRKEEYKGYSSGLFTQSLKGKLERIANRGDVETVKAALEYIKEKQAGMKRPMFTSRNKIWDLLDVAINKASESKPDGQDTYTINGINLVRNKDTDRLEIRFDGKPEQNVINDLKSSGWRWSPKAGAWQRKLTSNAEYSAKKIIEKNYPVEKNIKEKPTKAEEKQYTPTGAVDGLGLSNDPRELKNQIEDMKKRQKYLPIDLQLFAAAKKKYKRIIEVSKFFKNTLKHHRKLTLEERALFEEADFEYSKVSEEESVETAEKRLANDFDGWVKKLREKKLFDGFDLDTAMGILEVYRNEGRQTGDYGKMKEWAKVIRTRSTDAGRAVQAHAKYSRSPEDAVLQAQRTVDTAEEQMTKDNKGKIDDIDNEADVVDKVIQESGKQAEKDVSDTISEDEADVEDEEDKAAGKPKKQRKKRKSVNQVAKEKAEDELAERLAKKITNTTKGILGPKQKSVLDRMLDELYAKFRQTLPKEEMPQKDKIRELADAIRGRRLTGKAWTEAKRIVREEFEGDAEALSILDEYFGKGTKPPFAEKTLNEAVKQAMKRLDFKLSEMVKKYYEKGEKQRGELVDYIIQQSKLGEEDSRILANYVQAKIKDMRKEYAESYLEMVFRDNRPKNPTDIQQKAIDFIESLSNTGAFLNENYNNLVADRLSPKLRTLIKQSGVKMSELVRQGKSKVEFQRDKFVADLMERVKVNKYDAERIADIAERVFNNMANQARKKILSGILKQRDPVKRKTQIEKVLELINLEAYSFESVRDMIKQKYGLPILTNEDIDNILEWVEIRNTLEKDSYFYMLMEDRIETLIANKIPATLRDKTRGLQRIFLLLNPKTQIRNIGGNVIMVGTENIKDIPGAFIDYLTSAIMKTERTTSFDPLNKLKWQYQGLSKGIKQQVLDIRNKADTSYMGERYQIKKGKVFDSKFLNSLDMFVRSSLKFGDRPFFEAAYNMRANELMKLRGETQITDDVDAQAKLFAMERVFQNDSLLSKKFTALRKGMGVFGDIIIPFTQTPANVFDKLLDYTPVGFGKALWELGKISKKDSIKGVIKGEFNQKVFVDRLARALTGSGIILLGAVLAHMGLVSGGDYERGKTEKNKFLQAYRQAYSFLINGKWYSFDWAQPISGLLAIGVDMYLASKGKDDFVDTFSKGMTSGLDTLWNQSMLRGLLNVMSNFSLWGSSLKIGENALSQTNPTIMKQLASIVDDYVRETYDPNPAKRIANKYIARIPYLSKTLPAKVDITGEKIEAYNGANNVLNVMFNPGFIKDAKTTPEMDEIYEVFNATNETSVLPRVVEDTLTKTIDGVQYKLPLSAEQFVIYQVIAGKMTQDTIKELLKNNDYNNLNYEAKAEILSKVVKDSKAEAKEYIFNDWIEKKRLKKLNQ